MRQLQAAAPKPASAVIRIDADGSVTEVNLAALEALGYGREQILGTYYGRFLILSHPNRKPVDESLHDPVFSCVAAGQPVLSVYGMLRTAEGRGLRPVEVSIAPVYRAGAIAEVILIIEDDDLRLDT